MQDDVRRLQQLQSALRDQARVSGTCADEPRHAGGLAFAIRASSAPRIRVVRGRAVAGEHALGRSPAKTLSQKRSRAAGDVILAPTAPRQRPAHAASSPMRAGNQASICWRRRRASTGECPLLPTAMTSGVAIHHRRHDAVESSASSTTLHRHMASRAAVATRSLTCRSEVAAIDQDPVPDERRIEIARGMPNARRSRPGPPGSRTVPARSP